MKSLPSEGRRSRPGAGTRADREAVALPSLSPSELSHTAPSPFLLPSGAAAATLCGRAASPDPNCWVTLNFLNSVQLAVGDITASVSNFSAPSLLAPLPDFSRHFVLLSFSTSFFFFFCYV